MLVAAEERQKDATTTYCAIAAPSPLASFALLITAPGFYATAIDPHKALRSAD